MKVLFVDDSKTMLKINSMSVKKVLGEIEVLKAANGTDALKVAEENKPDLYLLDFVLPDMTGLDILEGLNKRGLNTIVGFISSLKTKENLEKVTKAGAKFFLDKPITQDSLKKVFTEVGILK